MFAVIETGGKQYKVIPGQKLIIEKLDLQPGAALVIDKVLLRADGDQIQFGTPYISGAVVEAKVLEQGRADKKIVFKYHAKTRYRKKKGHRQPFTEIEVLAIK